MPRLLLINNMENGNYGDGSGAGSEFNPMLIHLAFLCTAVGSCISVFSIWLHWKNYRKPNQQRQVTRILWMVPIYGISTYISLVSLNVAFYVDTFRDMYEAFVIYAFFNLLLNKLGGERALIIMLHSRPPSENFFPGTLYSREIFVGDPYTFLFVKRGILQFVYVKPILAIITMILKATGNYHEGQFTLNSSYFYLTFFYNLSVCLALWCLMVFFYATKKDLALFRPLPKFLCVKAIIFFSFWQSVVVALLVFAGIIPNSEHISVAIQDFLVCIEMVPFAIAHSFSFSYEDYFDQNVHSARMPIRKAIKDSFGVKDVIMDTLDTLRGSGFSYRSFEPSEGVPHMGSSRTSRIMAGLRYSNMTTKKHWLEPAPTSRFLNSSGRGMNEEVVSSHDSEPLEFEDPNSNDEMETLYEASRKMVFGDYNYPVIDFRIPLWRQAREERRLQRRSANGGKYGSTGGSGLFFGGGGGGGGGGSATSNNNGGKSKNKDYLGPREGCIDVIVKQGKDKYVVVDDLSSSDDEEAEIENIKPPLPPIRKPTLTDIKRNPTASSSTPTLSSVTIKKQAPNMTSSSSARTSKQQQNKTRYPQQQKRPTYINNNYDFNTPAPINPTPTTNSSFSVGSQQQRPIIHTRTTTASITKPTILPSPSEEDAPIWKWPNETRNKNSNSNSSSSSSSAFNDEDLLSGDVWK